MMAEYWVVETHILDYTGLSQSFGPYHQYFHLFESPLKEEEKRNPRGAFYLFYTILKNHMIFVLKNRYKFDRYEANLKDEENIHPKAASLMKCYMDQHRYTLTDIVQDKFKKWKASQEAQSISY